MTVEKSLAPAAIDEVRAALDSIRATHGVVIPLAIESGSRAWGFPSPDSDYDCRFIFVRTKAQYLSPWPQRDVIELPIEGELDVNGWDLVKALRLLAKGNAVVIEWLMSPFAYACEEQFREELIALARKLAHRDLIGRHYLHLGLRQRATYFADHQAVPVKKIFYALRPAAALRWLRLHSGAAIAPMHFPTLMAQCEAPVDVAEITANMLIRKAVTRELGHAPLPAPLARFIDAEFEAAAIAFSTFTPADWPEARAEAERFFRETVERFNPGAA